MRIKDIVELKNVKTDDHTMPYIGLENIESWNSRFVPTESVSEGINNRYSKGDILFGKLRPYLAKAYIALNSGVCSTEFFVLHVKKGYSNKYLLYRLLTPAFIGYISSKVAGVKMPRTSWADFSSISFDIPSLSTQERIVSYLDDKTAKIDRAVSLLQKKRDAYTRLKSSIINRAVTRGLNPNVKLKNSGVDWIGMIPENWDVKRIKNLYDYITRGATPKYVDYSNFKVMNQATFSKGFIDKDKIRYSNGMDSYARIRKGDLLIASTGGGVLGKLLYFKENEPDNFYADTHVTIIRSSNNTNSAKFLYYALYTKYDMINQTMVKGSTNQTELQRNYLLNYQIPIPSLTEQCAIADYLDIHCVNIDHAIFIVDKQIDAYTRLKKSLINEVVTGKRKV